MWSAAAGRPEVSRTPAAELARLKLAFPEWSIRRTLAGGFAARRMLPGGGGQTVRAETLAALEYELHLIERGEHPD